MPTPFSMVKSNSFTLHHQIFIKLKIFAISEKIKWNRYKKHMGFWEACESVQIYSFFMDDVSKKPYGVKS